MAEYTVLQDIEADDKIIGWMSLRQLFFAFFAGLILFLGFLVSRQVGSLLPMIFFILPASVLIILSLPLNKYQPMEVWLAARIRFIITPKRHIWDMSGIVNPITITAPKREKLRDTRVLSQSEVHSRLSALASTLDTRGWAYKKVTSTTNDYQTYNNSSDDQRLLNTVDLPSMVPDFDVRDSDDILDSQYNPTAMKLDQMMQASAAQLRDQASQKMFVNSQPPVAAPEPILPRPTITNNLNPSTVQFAKPTLLNYTPQASNQYPTMPDSAGSTASLPQAVRENLANRSDLNIASIATIAQKHQVNNLSNDTLTDDQTVSLR